MKIIDVKNLLKDYGNNRGIFNLDFEINRGQVVGFLGPNGAGKTTTIRFLLGLIKNDESKALINGLDCFNEQVEIQKIVGYLPGEIAFIDNFNAKEFLIFMANLKNMIDLSYAYELVDLLELNLNTPIKKMSKGMKQKLGIVVAFMNKPEVLILDEPSSGLDPLMQQVLIKLILKHKSLGATIFLSSHIFEEVEKTCDRVMIIKEGKIVADYLTHELKNHFTKNYLITFENEKEKMRFLKSNNCHLVNETTVDCPLDSNINEFLLNLTNYKIADITQKQQSIDEIFMKYYGDEND